MKFPKVLECDRDFVTQTVNVSAMHRLYCVSARTESGVHELLDRIEDGSIDVEERDLIQEKCKLNANGALFRGYVILAPGEIATRKVSVIEAERRPLWFVYSPFGSEWSGSGLDLMDIPIFADSIKRSAEAVRKYGVGLLGILHSSDRKIFDGNFVFRSVCITAVHIALTDVLTSMDIHPDGIVGHSNGDLSCSYADGSLTAEQAMQTSYVRTRIVDSHHEKNFAMLYFNKSWEEARAQCPDGVYLACNNFAGGVTVAGPKDSVDQMEAQLRDEGVAVCKLNSDGLAFHSPYIKGVVPEMYNELLKIIPEPKPRSKRWLSSMLPKDQWDSPLARTSSAEYHASNVTHPVLFKEVCEDIPRNAIIIELAPRCVLQLYLNPNIPDGIHLPLAPMNEPNIKTHFLSNIGELFIAGFHPTITNVNSFSESAEAVPSLQL